MAAAGAVPKLRFTPSLSSKAKAFAIPWIALLLPHLGTCLLGAIESKAGGEVPFWDAAPSSGAHTKAAGSEWGSISHALPTPCLLATIKIYWKKIKHFFPPRGTDALELWRFSMSVPSCTSAVRLEKVQHLERHGNQLSPVPHSTYEEPGVFDGHFCKEAKP